ncbi:hypothetical protein CDN99_00155 [Roseateles aquatilis]|uniref:Uncharacterized protein n=1 Tax=Roseateles aquatilis TaxID=431061 RepID=A0A246JK36_9BURK|nr:hypothetical protein CDN99_00155 [Roseateles aquatilis]
MPNACDDAPAAGRVDIRVVVRFSILVGVGLTAAPPASRPSRNAAVTGTAGVGGRGIEEIEGIAVVDMAGSRK